MTPSRDPAFVTDLWLGRNQAFRAVFTKNMNNTRAVLIVAGAILLGGCSTAHHATKWEYKRMAGIPGVSERTINQMAEQGWTVAGFSEYAAPDGTIRAAYLLKRPKQ